MRGAIYLVSLILAWLGVACSTTVDVAFDEREDFSRYRTWDWLPHAVPHVDAPHRDAPALDARLARLIERALRGRGFERTGDRADFFVTYQLVLRRQTVVVYVPFAPYLLSSNHSSPSYWIEGSEKESRVYEDIHLAIDVTEGRGRSIWHAALERRVEEGSALPLDDAVATLLERFPRHGARSDGDERR